MNKQEIIDLAMEIIRLDLLRDEMVEKLESVAGIQAFEILRWVQNGGLTSIPHHTSSC